MPPPRDERLPSRIVRLIREAGALATAIGAIVTLAIAAVVFFWPSDVADVGKITSVEFLALEPMTEFRERSTGLRPAGQQARGVPAAFSVRAVADQNDQIEPAPPPETTAPDVTSQASETTDIPESPDPDISSSATETVFGADPGMSVGVFADPVPIDYANDVIDKVSRELGIDTPTRAVEPPCEDPSVPASCLPTTGPISAITPVMTDPDGNPLPTEQAVEKVVAFFEHVRKGADADPVGAHLTVDLELTGLRDRTVILSWEIFQKGGGEPLLQEWLSAKPAVRLTPSTDRDSGSVDLWIPVPEDQGKYFVQLELSVDGASLESAVSMPFG